LPFPPEADLDVSPPRSRGDRTWPSLLVLLVAWVVLFSPQLFAHRAFLGGDARLFRRFSEFSRERWQADHQRTFWNPYVFFGIPATSSLADSRPQYLPDALLDGVERVRRIPGLPPLAGPLACHLAGTLAMALLARALWNAGFEGMTWAGIVWALAPSLLVPLAFGHDAQFASASLIPVQLLLVHALFAARDGLRVAWAALGLGITLGVQCLGGHPQMVAAGGALVCVFAVERVWHTRRPGRLVALALAGLLGISMSAAVWWPALLYGRISVRGGPGGVDASEVASFSNAWRDLLSLAWPQAVGFGGASYWGGLRRTDYPQFAGTLVCVLSLLAWPRRGRGERGAVVAFAAMAIGGALLSLGSNLEPLDRLLRQHVPLFSRFRVAAGWLIITQLALALLSSLGLERLTSASARNRASHRVLARIGLAALFGAALGQALAWSELGELFASFPRGVHPSLAIDLARQAAHRAGQDLTLHTLLLAALPAVWFATPRGSRRRWATAATLALHAVDLGSVSVPFLIGAAGPAERLLPLPPPAIARIDAGDPSARAMPFESALASTNDWVAWRARCVVGVHGAVYRDWSTLMAGGLQYHYEALCALAVRYTTVASSAPESPELWHSIARAADGSRVVRLTRAQPRAYCVPRVSAPGDRRDVLTALFSPEFRAAEDALAEEPAIAGAYPGSRACTIRWLEDSPDVLRLECDARDRAFLVVADPLLPGWSATLDGRASPIWRVDFMVRGVVLPAGRHVVEMRYLPEGWAESVPITRGSLAAIGLLIVSLGVAEIARRRAPA
jgi:hypothetical protein